MGLGVLEASVPVVQGTIQLFDKIISGAEDDGHNTTRLKHTKDGKIVLAPQPSDSPNDPLNWPLWQRDAMFIGVLICTILSGIHGPMLSPVTVELSLSFNKSINDIAQLSSYMLLVVGVTAYFDSSIARLYGKRGPFVISILLLTVSDIWAACSNSYGSLMGARVFSGIGQAAFEALSLSIVPDLYFVHQRGTRIALMLFFLQTGVYLGVPISTQIMTERGYQWGFGALAIAEGIMTIVLAFTFFEPTYTRAHIDPLANESEDCIMDHVNDTLVDGEKAGAAGSQLEHKHTRADIERMNSAAAERPKSFKQQLNLYQGRFTSQGFITLLARTFALTFHPTILWVAIAGLPLSWAVGFSFLSAAVLVPPPYNFSANAVGNFFIAPWIGCVLALAIFGLSADWFCGWVSKKNNNVYEPEFRLILALPSTMLTILGMVGWGWGIEAQIPWVGLAVFFSCASAGGLALNLAVIGYVIDAHRQYAVESQVILFVTKNIFPFGMGYYFVPWSLEAGHKAVWGIVSSITGGVVFLGVGFYMFGKRLRAYWSVHPFLGIKEI